MSWTSTTETVDSLIRDYLSQRGFTNTLKTFDSEIKSDKEKGFKAEKVLQQILNYVLTSDLDSLRAYWNHMDSRIFCRFEQTHAATVKKMEHNLYKYYLVICMQNGKRKECFEFFEKLAQELSGLPDWKDWFSFPFTVQPETNKTFSHYFTKAWTDTFAISLHNFLAVVFACIPAPQLFDIFLQDKLKIEQLEREVEYLNNRIISENFFHNSDQKIATHNYVKSLITPASMTDNATVTSQPQKKKSLGFPFSTKKNSPIASIKSKGTLSTAPKPSAKSVEPVQSSSDPSITHLAHHDVQHASQKSKKVSGLQMQRKELLGSALNKAKSYKSYTNREISNSPPPSSLPITIPAHPASSSVIQPKISSSPSQSTVAVSTINKSANYPLENAVSQSKEAEIPLLNHTSTPETPTILSCGSNQRHNLLLLSKDEYQEHHSAIMQGRFNPTGETVASCDKDGIVKIWMYEPSLTTIATIMSRSPYLSLEWCKSSNNLLLLGSSTGNLRLYDTTLKQVQHDVTCTFPNVSHISFSPKVDMFATSSVTSPPGSDNPKYSSGRLELWKLTSSHLELSTLLHDGTMSDIRSIVFHPKSDILVCGDSKGKLMIFDTLSGQSILNKTTHDGAVYSIEIVEKYIFTLGVDGQLLSWDLRNMEEPIKFPIHPRAAGPFEVSGFGGYRQVHKPSGGKLFAFEPDGYHILTCDGIASPVYSVDVSSASLKKDMTLMGHRSPVVSVDWITSYKCGRCLSGSMDGKIHVTTLLHQ